MNGLQNEIAGALPVVAAETPATATRIKAPVIAARKVQKGKCGHKAGAPLKTIIGLSNNRRKSAFTKRDIFDLNGQTISELCIDQRLKRLIKAKELVCLGQSAKVKGAGRPPLVYSFDLSKAPAKKGKKAKAVAAETAPVVGPEAAPAPAQAPVEAAVA